MEDDPTTNHQDQGEEMWVSVMVASKDVSSFGGLLVKALDYGSKDPGFQSH